MAKQASDKAQGKMLTGAEIVIRCLQEEKVEHVFGYPGGAVLYIYDALSQQDKVELVASHSWRLARRTRGSLTRLQTRMARPLAKTRHRVSEVAL